MEGRKVNAIDIAINCVKDVRSDSYEVDCAKNDIISVLEEARRYFIDQEKPRVATIADNYPPGFREPICRECVIYEEIKEEVAGELLDALTNLVADISRYSVYPTYSNEMNQARAAIAKAREEG